MGETRTVLTWKHNTRRNSGKMVVVKEKTESISRIHEIIRYRTDREAQARPRSEAKFLAGGGHTLTCGKKEGFSSKELSGSREPLHL